MVSSIGRLNCWFFLGGYKDNMEKVLCQYPFRKSFKKSPNDIHRYKNDIQSIHFYIKQTVALSCATVCLSVFFFHRRFGLFQNGHGGAEQFFRGQLGVAEQDGRFLGGGKQQAFVRLFQGGVEAGGV